MKKCCLISGGWDSAACYFKLPNKHEYEYIFIKYGQIYYENEYMTAKTFLNSQKQDLRVVYINLTHDQPRRNMFFINEIKRLGYEEMVIGSRNILPIFDKYKDSNWLSLKIYGWLMGIKITLPITGWGKSKVVNFVKSHYRGNLYNCYNNGTNIINCSCVNCQELRSLGIENT